MQLGYRVAARTAEMPANSAKLQVVPDWGMGSSSQRYSFQRLPDVRATLTLTLSKLFDDPTMVSHRPQSMQRAHLSHET